MRESAIGYTAHMDYERRRQVKEISGLKECQISPHGRSLARSLRPQDDRILNFVAERPVKCDDQKP